MSTNLNDVDLLKELASANQKLKNEISKVIIGQDEVVSQLLITLFAKGHCLLVGVPGLAKTLLIKSLSDSLSLKYSRIQFTPDLMPGDITGTEVIDDDINSGLKKFRFVKGPVFANIVLADEINRTPPKTQAALLEAMQEQSVTASGQTLNLEPPFFVLATQNPIEQEGTYPLPEAQLDRFMFNIWLDYPSFNEEIDIVKATTIETKPKIEHILTAEKIITYQNLVRRIPVSDNVINYAVKLVRATRPKESKYKIAQDYISYGAGPRASQFLILGAKAKCAIDGRFSPEIEDIKYVSSLVLRHRIVTNFNAEADNIPVTEIISNIIKELQ